jgi:ribosomal protein L3 glutamine methyltransferase
MQPVSHNRMEPPRDAFVAAVPGAATVAELIEFGAREFERAGLAFGHGTDNAVDDAAALVFHVLGLDHNDAARAYPQKAGATDVERVLAIFTERMVRRVPAAYLIGRMWFAGYEFEVDPSVIVPRSPFAELILDGFEPWIDSSHVHRMLDIGTGSGCIAIVCALQFPQAHVDAVDMSPAALEVAQRNATRHDVQARLRLLQGDVYEPLLHERYDVIVSNPPYVSESEMTVLPPEYRHEPDVALRAGVDGLDVVRRILAGAERWLAPHGALFVEVGDSEERLQSAYPSVPFTWLEFEHGGGGVFVLTHAELVRHRLALETAGDPCPATR